MSFSDEGPAAQQHAQLRAQEAFGFGCCLLVRVGRVGGMLGGPHD